MLQLRPPRWRRLPPSPSPPAVPPPTICVRCHSYDDSIPMAGHVMPPPDSAHAAAPPFAWRRLPPSLPPRPPPRLLTTDDTDTCQRAIELLFTAQASAYARLLTPPTPPESPPQQTWLGHVGGPHAAQHRLAAPQSIPATLSSGTRFLVLLPGSVCALSAPVAMLVDRAGNPGVDAGLRSLRPVRDQPHAQPFALSARALLCRSVSGHYGGLFATVRDQPPVLAVWVSTPQCGTSPHVLSCSRPHFARATRCPSLLFLLLPLVRGLFASMRDQPLCRSHCSASWSARVLSLGVHTLLAILAHYAVGSLLRPLLALHAICTLHHDPTTHTMRLQRHARDNTRQHSTTLDNPPMLHDAPLPPIRTLGLFA